MQILNPQDFDAQIKPDLTWYFLAYLLFMVGAFLAHFESGSELSLWVVSFGLALDLALLLLALFGKSSLKIIRKGSPFILKWAVFAHILALLLCLLSIPVRFLSYIFQFHGLLALSQLLWSYSIIIFRRHARK